MPPTVPNTTTITDSQRTVERSSRAGLADGSQQPELPGALVDRQRQRVGDAHQGDQDGEAEHAVDDEQHLVDLRPEAVDVLRSGLRVRVPRCVR